MRNKTAFPTSDRSQAPLTALLHKVTGEMIGYRIGGHTPGPELLVVGYRTASAEPFHRLAQLPSLPYLKGRVTLIYLEALEDIRSGVGYASIARRKIDGSMFISYDADRMNDSSLERVRTEAYWSVLRLCTRFGMITGRGLKEAEPDNQYIMEGMISPSLTREGLLEACRKLQERLVLDALQVAAPA